MDLQDFAQTYSNQQSSTSQQPVRRFKLGKDVSAKIVIPRPADGKSLLGVTKAIYVHGPKGGRTIQVTEETYDLLLSRGVVPAVKAASGEEYPAPARTRVLVNVLDLSSGEIRVWETSRSIAMRLADLDKDPDTPGIHDAILKLTKRSTGPRPMDVEYDIQVLGRAELTSEQESACQELYDVERLAEPHSREFILRFLGIEDASNEPDDDVPF